MTNQIVAIPKFTEVLKIIQIRNILAVGKLSGWLCLLYCSYRAVMPAVSEVGDQSDMKQRIDIFL
jgi:hypothetical protein